MREEILRLLSDDHNHERTIQDLTRIFKIKSEDFADFMKLLNQLEDDGEIVRDQFNQYFTPESLGYFKGVLQLNKKGFGFVKVAEDKEFFVRSNLVNGALNGDTVIIHKLNDDPHSDEASIVRVLEHNIKDVVGLVVKLKGKTYVNADDSRIGQIRINDAHIKGAMPGHKVIVHITSYKPLRGDIVEIIGHKNDPGVDILSIVYDHGIHIDFPEEVYQQVENIPDEIDPAGMKGRTDLRDMLIVTIDGDEAKDLDDAISLRKLENKHYELGVHIADVSYYVEEGTPLDLEAVDRGTSVYLVDRVIPMLPHKLSNGICSLNEGVDRYTISCFMEIDQKGQVVDHRILPTVIHSTHRMTYTNVNKILDGDQEMRKKYADSVELFETMKELSDILTRARNIRGAIDFDTDEAKIIVDEKGKPIDVQLRVRGESDRMIESFMLAANETVAEHFKWLDVPFIYRVHETPKKNKLEQFLAIAKPLGYNIHGSLDDIKPKELAKIITKSKGKPEHPVISTLLLRSMQKARYSELCLGHFGLADEYYTHFTSPIRRYPDLLVHRLIRNYLFNENYSNIEHFSEVVPQLADSSSDCEKRAVDTEYDVDDMKKAEYMSYHIGEKFKGIISSVTSFGFFVELPNTIEGLVHITDLADDYYIYDEKQLMLIGQRTRKMYRLSDTVEVIVKDANKLEKQVDFVDANNYAKSRKPRRAKRSSIAHPTSRKNKEHRGQRTHTRARRRGGKR